LIRNSNEHFNNETINFDPSKYLKIIDLVLDKAESQRIGNSYKMKSIKDLKSLTLFANKNDKQVALKNLNKKFQKSSLIKYSHLFGDVERPLNSEGNSLYDNNCLENKFLHSKCLTPTNFSIVNDKITSQRSRKNSFALKQKIDELAKAKIRKNSDFV